MGSIRALQNEPGPRGIDQGPQDVSGPRKTDQGPQEEPKLDKSGSTERIRAPQYEPGLRGTDQDPERQIRARRTKQGSSERIRPEEQIRTPMDEPELSRDVAKGGECVRPLGFPGPRGPKAREGQKPAGSNRNPHRSHEICAETDKKKKNTSGQLGPSDHLGPPEK